MIGTTPLLFQSSGTLPRRAAAIQHYGLAAPLVKTRPKLWIPSDLIQAVSHTGAPRVGAIVRTRGRAGPRLHTVCHG